MQVLARISGRSHPCSDLYLGSDATLSSAQGVTEASSQRERVYLGIRSKPEYLFYLEADRVSLKLHRKRPKLFGDEIWKFQRLLRTVEFYENCRTSLFWRPLLVYYSIIFRLYGLLLGYTIPQHVFGPGLAIANRGTIVVNSCARVGENVRFMSV